MRSSSIALPARPLRQSGFARLDPHWADIAAAALLVSSVSFNAMLAVINAHVFQIGNSLVALTQAAIVFAAIGVAILARPPEAGRWLAFAWVTMLLFAVVSIGRGSIEPKLAGDMLLIPAFVAIGLCIRKNTLISTITIFQYVLVFFVIWELFFPTSFGDFFKVRDYYVNTRGFSEEAFWAGDDNLFLSSQRPGGRLIDLGIQVNRGSSLFLEPVTLGNWTVIVACAITAFWRDMTRTTRSVLIIGNIMLLWACDGRLAMGVNAIILISTPIFLLLPQRRWFPVAYLPIVAALLFVAFAAGIISIDGGYDDLPGRYGFSVHYLQSLNLREFAGLTRGGASAAADSGWVHIILTQSILGLIAYWLALTALATGGVRTERFRHTAALYIAIALPISYSVLSIKSGAMLWLLLGACIAADRQLRSDRTAKRL